MIRFHARCEICMGDIFDRHQVKSYGLRNRKPYPEELGDASGPWCGVRCVCLPCIEFVSSLARNPQNAPGRDDDDWLDT